MKKAKNKKLDIKKIEVIYKEVKPKKESKNPKYTNAFRFGEP